MTGRSKTLVLVLSFFLFSIDLSSQQFIVGARTDQICYLYLQQCDTAIWYNERQLDYEFMLLPDSTLLNLGTDGRIQLFELYPSLYGYGRFGGLSRFPPRIDGQVRRYHAISTDGKGRVYAAGNALAAYDYVNDRMTYYGDDMMINLVEAIAFHDGRFIGLRRFGTSRDPDPYYEVIEMDTVNLNHQVLFRIDAAQVHNAFNAAAMCSYNPSCDSSRLFMIASDGVERRNTAFTVVLEIDLDNQSVTELCHIDSKNIAMRGINHHNSFRGGLCDLSIDLDENDSTTPGLGYVDTLLCATDTSPIHDDDWWIYSDGIIDSVTIDIRAPVFDAPLEQIIIPAATPDFSIISRTNGLTITNAGGVEWTVVKAFLDEVFYVINQPYPTAGERKIDVVVYDNGDSASATARLYVPEKFPPGTSGMVTLCVDGRIIDLYQAIGPPKTAGGTWSHGSPFFQPGVDTAGRYFYTIDQQQCGLDSTFVDVAYHQRPDFDLGPDTVICRGETVALSVPFPDDQVTWSDGFMGAVRWIDQSGIYRVEVEDENGCHYRDTIMITVEDDLIPQDSVVSICDGEQFSYKGDRYRPGERILDTLSATTGCDTLLSIDVRGMALPKRDTVIELCENETFTYRGRVYNIGQSITDTIEASRGCDSVVNIALIGRDLIEDDRIVEICPGEVYLYNGVAYDVGDNILDTLVATQGCDTVLFIQLQRRPVVDVQITGTTMWCEGDSAILRVETDASNWQWSTGQTSREIKVKTAGTYWVEAFGDQECDNVDSVTTMVLPLPDVTIEGTDVSCEGLQDGAIGFASPRGAYEYVINGDTTDENGISELPAGNYDVEVISGSGCRIRERVTIDQGSRLNVNLGPDIKAHTSDTTVTISADVFGAQPDSIHWQINGRDTSIAGLSFRLNQISNLQIIVQVTDANGCFGSDTLHIEVDIPEDVFVPNIFSPNGDGLNDKLSIFGADDLIRIEQLTIFDRWGEKVYHTTAQEINQSDQGWDGTFRGEQAPSGVYIYVLGYMHPEEGLVMRSGEVTVMR